VFTGATLPVPSSIILDPAALALMKPALEFYAAATGTLDQLSIDRKMIDLGTGALTNGARVRGVTSSPGADLGLVWRPADNVAGGFLLRTPPGQEMLGGQNALRYYTLGGHQREMYAAFAISFKVTSDFLFGVSIEADKTYLSMRFARDTALAGGTGAGGVTSSCGSVACGTENPAASETYDVKVEQPSSLGDGYVVNIGGMYQISRDVWLAASYHTPPGGATSVNNTLEGTAVITQAARDGGATLSSGATVYISEPVTVDAELRAKLPNDLELHVGGRWEDLSRNTGYDVRPYGSTLADNGIPNWVERPRGFQDTLALWGGVEQIDHGQTWRFGGRLGFETAALPDSATTPITIAPTSATLDLGAQLREGPWTFQLSYGLQYFPTVSVGKSDFDPRDAVTCVDSGYDYSTPACAALRNGYAIPTAAGDYGRIEHAVRLGVRFEY
jgi:hypothetical protein